jgi:hypothetical protein
VLCECQSGCKFGVGHDPEVGIVGRVPEEAWSADPLGDVAHGGADSTGVRGAVDVFGVAVGAVEAHKGDGGNPEVTEGSWGWGAG